MDAIVLLVVLITSIWVLIDAKSIGVEKGLITGMGNMGPWAWFFVCLLLWIVGFPFYLAKRGQFKKAKIQNPGFESSGSVDDLQKLSDLKEKGVLTDDEFSKKKQEIINGK